MGGFFSVLFMCFKQAPKQGRHLPNKIRHQRWCWRLVWEWKCDGARTPIMLTLWYRTAIDANEAHGQSFADFLRWIFFQVDMIYDHDLHPFFSRFQIQSNEKFGSAIATSCHMHIRDSNFTKSDRGTWWHQNWFLLTPIMAKWVSRSQNSTFTCFLKYLEHQKWYLATSNMAKRVVIEKSHLAWAGLIGISQPFQLTLWLANALATVTWHVRRSHHKI